MNTFYINPKSVEYINEYETGFSLRTRSGMEIDVAKTDQTISQIAALRSAINLIPVERDLEEIRKRFKSNTKKS